MKNKILIFLLFLFSAIAAYAQSSYDGISIQASKSNRTSFYFGEPVSFIYSIKNNTDVPKFYWKKMTGVNIVYTLTELDNGKVVGSSELFWEMFRESRHHAKNTQPDETMSFQPNEELLINIGLGLDIAVDGMINLKYNDEIGFDLLHLPIGKYKLVVEYHLLPSGDKINAFHEFAIKELPEHEKEAFNAFIESTNYAAENNYFNKNKYDINNQKSYEVFISKYPESIFSQYAYSNLVNKIYRFGRIPVNENQKKKIYKEYLSHNIITLPNLKVKQGRAAIKILRKPGMTGMNNEKVLEQLLTNFENEDPVISDELIILSEKILKIRGLRNKANKK
jgi:hypothetical protein